MESITIFGQEIPRLYVFYGIGIYLLLINTIAFIAYGVDKRRAREGQWRIPERRLLGLAFWGGALGAFVGMNVLRHKTKHTKFRVVVPLYLVLWTAGLIFLSVKLFA